MERHAPAGQPQTLEFRLDLGRLLVIAIVSAYEESVRAVLVERANGYHVDFGHYVEADCRRLNARIKVFQLRQLAGKFGPEPGRTFKREMNSVQDRFLVKANIDVADIYDNLLERRNSLAHSGEIKVSIEEAMFWHRLAKQVIYAFDRSLRTK